ncbi:MAG: acyl-CoA dehydrogenase family protein [Tepidiformaceae bacterium]
MTTPTAIREETGSLIEAARRMAPAIAARADEIERERRVPLELINEMRAAGFFRMLVPADLGGLETDPVTAAKVVEEVSSADGSAGWCVMIGNQNAAFSGLADQGFARELWGSGGITAGTARPIGRAVAKGGPGGGYSVSGRWPFASGSSHADWFAAECVVYDGDSPRLDANGESVTRMVFVPNTEVTIHDTWHTTGLRGTASNDFSVESSFVPEERGFQMIVDEPRNSWALFSALPLLFINHGSRSMGVARSALKEAVRIVNSKRGWGDQPLNQGLRMQSVIAEATVALESARAYLYQTATALWESVLAGEDDGRLRARVRLATSHSSRASVQAVDLVHAAVGTAALFPSSPLERHFRDIHMAAAHVMVGQMTYEAAGRVELGISPDFPFF